MFPSTGKRENILLATIRGENVAETSHARYLRHVVRTLVDRQPPALLLECVNIVLHRRFADFGEEDRSAGLFFGALQGGVLSYAFAGPVYASFIPIEEVGYDLTSPAKPLGKKPAQRFVQRTIDVSPGDRLVVAGTRIDLRNPAGADPLDIRFG